MEVCPTLKVADTPVMSLGPNSSPKVPTLDVEDTPVISTAPNDSPKVPKDKVEDCPERATVGLITKLTSSTLVVAS